ncbi:hypothetical protein ACL02T_22155 [Pseudonocardia sp. RS010]|uniref:hypothetical protein n=1 Tax=Pseudonocardia sp. RS010 TaxID=3385979 RepID=UPI0039A2E40D
MTGFIDGQVWFTDFDTTHLPPGPMHHPARLVPGGQLADDAVADGRGLDALLPADLSDDRASQPPRSLVSSSVRQSRRVSSAS